MTGAVEANAVHFALTERLRAVAPLLLPDGPVDVDADVSVLLDELVRVVRGDLTPERVWLLSVAMSGALPGPDHVVEAMRELELADVTDSTLWLLESCGELARRSGNGGRELRVVTGGVVIEVDHTARADLHTGIQQVIRQTVPRWYRDHQVVLAGWTPGGAALRPLTEVERDRVLTWGRQPVPGDGTAGLGEPADLPVIVPWRSVVVLPDFAAPESMGPLTALARFSTNRVVAVGYDCIPVVSADMVPVGGAHRFAHYLSVLKHMDRVATVSASAAVEFQGFVDTLPAQGLPGPVVTECPLPSEPVTRRPTRRPGRPLVLAVGSFEPRKNHLGMLYAAETLWREGLSFELIFIGGMGWGTEVPALVDKLRTAGRPVTMRHRVSQEDLDQAYADARFTVFPSLHEGFGLPVAESFAAGVPTITSNFGSTAETAAAGGALLIDPRDDEALASAMRVLLTDDHRLDELRTQIAHRPTRNWDDYASQLWTSLVRTELQAINQDHAA